MKSCQQVFILLCIKIYRKYIFLSQLVNYIQNNKENLIPQFTGSLKKNEQLQNQQQKLPVSRAFGRDISQMFNIDNSQQQNNQSKLGRSLSMHMNPSLNKQVQPQNPSQVIPKKQKKNVFQDLNINPQTYKEQMQALKQNLQFKMEQFDKDNVHQPQFISVYVKEIFENLKMVENKYTAKGDYMELQNDINAKMRGILIDWLVEVHYKFKMLPETLYLTVNLIDRYLEKQQISRTHLQLVGVTALFIACKYEEIYPPELKDFVYVTDNAYTKQEVIDMEGKIISALEFNITTPSPIRFLERFQNLATMTEQQKMLCQYILEITILDVKMLKYSPSMLAAACVYLVNKLFKREHPWDDVMVQNTQFHESQIRPCAKDLCFLLQNADKTVFQAIRRKYGQPKYHCVSNVQLARI